MRVVKALKIFRAITWIIIVLYLLMCFAGFVLVKMSNLSYYVILSGSMQPEINVDDVVVSQNLDETEVDQKVSIGDVATYYDGKSYVTHRVYDKTSSQDGETVYIFKGDNNNTIDRYSVKATQIRGKQVYTLKNFAGIFEFLNSIYGMIALISVLLLLFMVENTLAYAINYQHEKLQSKTDGEAIPNDNLQPQS